MTDTTPNPFELWDENELSDRIGIPVATIKAWRTRGGGPPFVRLGAKKAKYRPTAVLAWIESQEQTVDRKRVG